MYLKIRIVTAMFLAMLSFLPALAGMRLVPHVTRANGSYQTLIHLKNQGPEDVSYRLLPYSMAGEVAEVISGKIAAGEEQSIPAASTFNIETSHFKIDAPSTLEVSVSYGSLANKTTTQLVPALDKGATSWLFSASDWSHEFDGYALVNMGEKSSDVWLHQRDDSGTIVASQQLAKQLAPNAKMFGLIDTAPFKDSYIKSGGTAIFEIIADQHLALLSLTADTSGALSIKQASVKRESESERDEVHTWFITGGSLSDVFEMFGYNVATDRLWQAELYRRTSLGTMAEIFGSSMIGSDINLRTTGYSIAELQTGFDGLTEDERLSISSYVDGFNRRIAEVRADPTLMPFEFLALGFSPANWSVIDVMAWATTLQHSFTPSYGFTFQLTELAALQDLVARFGNIAGATMFIDFNWLNDPSAQTMIHPEQVEDKEITYYNFEEKPVSKGALPVILDGVPDVRELALRWEQESEDRVAQLQKLGAFVKGGSYAWVVSGDKTASGNPILFSGPQLENPAAFSAPGVVVEGSIRGGGIEVSGMAVAGVPSIIVGRTPHHAWSFQVGHATVGDLYFDTPAQITGQRMEIIHVANGEDVVLPVATSVHGVVVNAEPLISYKYSQRDYEFNFLKATLGLARAQSMDEFGEAVAELAVSMHICYADDDGNIAYWHTGREPVRPKGEWRLPQGTVAAPLEYDVEVIEPLYHDRNAPQGYYGGWNNKAHPDWVDLGSAFRYGTYHAAHVIDDYLASGSDFTFEDVAFLDTHIAHQFSSIGGAGKPWDFVKDLFLTVGRANPTPQRTEAMDVIEAWDGRPVSGSVANWTTTYDLQEGYVVQESWIGSVLLRIFADELSGPLYGNIGSNRFTTFLHLLGEPDAPRNSYNWFRSYTGDGPGTLNEIILTALDDAVDFLNSQSTRPWGIGWRDQTTYNHALFGDLSQIFPEIATPYSNRSTWSQCVEYGPEGPVRIGTYYVLGNSGNVAVDASGMPVLNALLFAQTPYYNNFNLRPFPLFD